jgi:polysaccharide export outer membrane protein
MEKNKYYISFLTVLIVITFTSLSINIAAQEESYFIKKGDVLSVEVMEHPEFNRSNLLVLPDGTIQYPVLGDLVVAGISPAQLADSIKKALDVDYVVNPIVTVYVNRLEKNNINVLGGVRNPGRYQIFEPVSLLEALSLAGGVTSLKHTRKIIIAKKDGSSSVYKIKRSLKRNNLNASDFPLIYPDDTIVVVTREINWSKYSFFIVLTNAALQIILLFVK